MDLTLRSYRLLALLLLLPLLTLAAPGTSRAASGDPAWGVLASSCDASRNATNRDTGVTTVVVEAYWDRFLPQKAGTVDTSYVSALQAKVTACLNAGLRVVLGSGTQYPPAWVKALSGAAYKDQRGKAPTNGAVDVVFSQNVRAAEADYLKRLVAAVPAAKLDGIRVGTSNAGEIGYPGPNDAGDGFLQSWWAFGDAAQKGTGLASGMSKSPMPGWVPGARTWNGSAVSADAARNWYLWYSRALLYSLKFQVDTLRGAGYSGAVHVPAPGKGVLPKDLTAAVNARLDGTGDRDSSLGRGLNYVDQFPVLAGNVSGPVVVDLTSVDDATMVAARDTCTGSDASASTVDSTPTENWSNLRVARAQAARAGLAAVGENPGPPASQTGGTASSDSELDQVRRSPGYARGCALAAFYLAFEDDLYTGRSGVTAADYAAAIRPPA